MGGACLVYFILYVYKYEFFLLEVWVLLVFRSESALLDNYVQKELHVC